MKEKELHKKEIPREREKAHEDDTMETREMIQKIYRVTVMPWEDQEFLESLLKPLAMFALFIMTFSIILLICVIVFV